MSYMDEFNFWLNDDYFDQATKDELLAIRNNEGEIEERFYKELEFGTGGLRGVIGAGTNRMNIYTVRKASQGLANYITRQTDRRRALQLHMIPVSCLLNLLTKLHCVWLLTALRHMYLNH